MNSKETRKEAIRKFKEQRPRTGAFAVRCLTSGNLWVGTSRNLSAEKNGCWFCLRVGTHREGSLQKEWNEHGESSFQFETLEEFENELHPLELIDLLKTKRTEWVTRLGARSL